MSELFDTLLTVFMWISLGLGLVVVSALWGFLNLIFVVQTIEMITDFFGSDEEEPF